VEWDAPDAQYVVIAGDTFHPSGHATFRGTAGAMVSLTAIGALDGQPGETRHVYLSECCGQHWPLAGADRAALTAQRASAPGMNAAARLLTSGLTGVRTPRLSPPPRASRRPRAPRLLQPAWLRLSVRRRLPANPRVDGPPMASSRGQAPRNAARPGGTGPHGRETPSAEEHSWDAC
jgi:hypothetical protein